jgi:hypothetical protein
LQDLSGVKGNEKKNEKIKSKRKAHSGKKVTDKTKGSNENNDISGKNNEFKNGKKNSGLKRNGDELSGNKFMSRMHECNTSTRFLLLFVHHLISFDIT